MRYGLLETRDGMNVRDWLHVEDHAEALTAREREIRSAEDGTVCRRLGDSGHA